MTEQSNEQSQGNPAWQPVLDALNDLPDEFRQLIEPKIRPQLEDWDKRAQDKIEDVRSQYSNYEPYKPLIENNVDPQLIQKSMWLAQKLEEDPNFVVEQAIKTYGLEYAPVQKQQQQRRNSSEDEDYNYEDDDDNMGDIDLKGLENHPAFKALQEKAQQVESFLNKQREQEEYAQAESEMQGELRELHEKYDSEDGTSGFDDLYVATLIDNGIDPHDAVKMFNETVNTRARALAGLEQQNEEPPPVVMGGDGATGSGIAQEPVKMGALGKGDVHDMVLQLINADKQA